MNEAVTIGVEAYVSPEYARAERDRLWRKVWLKVGRVEELPEVGDYMTFDLLDDAILIVRAAPDRLRAFGNVCSHRGRRLVDTPEGAYHTRGRQRKFVCGFHAWTFDLEGRCAHALEKADWNGALTEDRTRLSLFMTACGAILNVLLNLWLIPRFGAMGAAYATLTSFAVSHWLAAIFFVESRPLIWFFLRAFDPVGLSRRWRAIRP